LWCAPTTAGEQAFGGESVAAADRCDRTGAPKARKPSERSERPALEGTNKEKRSESWRLGLKDTEIPPQHTPNPL